MDDTTGHQVTALLREWKSGKEAAFEQVLPLVYQELHALAHRHMISERADHTLQTTALLHEACMRLMGSDVQWNDRLHFFAVASRVMRRILVDHARAHRSEKRGGGEPKLPLDNALDAAVQRPWDLLDLDEALGRLGEHDARKAQVVELHYFGGLKIDEIGRVLEISHGAAAWDLRMAKAWLRKELRQA